MNPQERHALDKILERGLRVTPFGQAWRIFGPGVDLLTAKLSSLSSTDLRPAAEFKSKTKGTS